MPKPYPREFRENVVAVARQGDAGIAQIAKDFGIAESCLRNWLNDADAEDGKRGGPKAEEPEQLRELKRRSRLLEQENEAIESGTLYHSMHGLLMYYARMYGRKNLGTMAPFMLPRPPDPVMVKK